MAHLLAILGYSGLFSGALGFPGKGLGKSCMYCPRLGTMAGIGSLAFDMQASGYDVGLVQTLIPF